MHQIFLKTSRLAWTGVEANMAVQSNTKLCRVADAAYQLPFGWNHECT